MNTKDTYWFRHDSNAKDDFKCMQLIEQLGCEGYGIFWILVETLREQKDYRYPFSLLSALARKYNTTQAKMETVVTKYELFEIEKDTFFFFSNSLNLRMENLDKIKEQRRLAGLKSGEARKKKSLEQKENKCSTSDELLNKNGDKKKEKEELKLLKQLFKQKSANAILELNKTKDYEDLFTDTTNKFITNHGGLVKLRSTLQSDSFDEWALLELSR